MRSVLNKAVVAGIAVGLLATTSACGSTSGSGSAGGGGGKELTIAMVPGITSDPFFKAMKLGADDAAKSLHVNLLWQGSDKEYSPQTQIPYVDAVLAKKPDGLVLIPTDPKSLQPSVQKAQALKIPVITVDTTVDDEGPLVAFITGDNVDGGKKAADAMATAIHYKQGGSYQVVVGSSSATTTTGTRRMQGFEGQLKAKYPGIEVVDKAYSQSKPEIANTNVNNWLIKYPKLSGIFAIDGTNGTGAAAALQAKKLVGKIALIGYDAYPDNVTLLEKGVFSALIAQQPAAEAKMALTAMVDKIKRGKSGIKKDVVIPNVIMTKDNLASTKKYTYVQ
jgi:ribose transport system substrate-binding protein